MIKKKKNKTKSSAVKKVADNDMSKAKKKASKKRPSRKHRSKNQDTKNSVSKKREAKQSAGKRSKRIIDPEAKLEAKRYQNPVASRTLLLERVNANRLRWIQSVAYRRPVFRKNPEGPSASRRP